MLEILFNVPNGLGLLRLLLIVIMIVNLSKSPRKSLACCLSSGLLNILDGMLASLLNQRTLFGVFLDGFLDRLTTTVFMFYLVTLMPKYWFLIFLVKFVEFCSDLLSHQVSNVENVLSIYTFIYDEADGFSVKSAINKTQLPLRKLLDALVVAGKPTFELILDEPPRTSETEASGDLVYKYIFQAVWTLNDLFYWLLLFKCQGCSRTEKLTPEFLRKDCQTFLKWPKKRTCNLEFFVSCLDTVCCFCAIVSFVLNLRNAWQYIHQLLAFDKRVVEM